MQRDDAKPDCRRRMTPRRRTKTVPRKTGFAGGQATPDQTGKSEATSVREQASPSGPANSNPEGTLPDNAALRSFYPTRARLQGHRARQRTARQPASRPARQRPSPFPHPGTRNMPFFRHPSTFPVDSFGHRGYTPFLACRDVAQPGSAPEWGSGGRRFKSSHPDQLRHAKAADRKIGGLLCLSFPMASPRFSFPLHASRISSLAFQSQPASLGCRPFVRTQIFVNAHITTLGRNLDDTTLVDSPQSPATLVRIFKKFILVQQNPAVPLLCYDRAHLYIACAILL